MRTVLRHVQDDGVTTLFNLPRTPRIDLMDVTSESIRVEMDVIAGDPSIKMVVSLRLRPWSEESANNNYVWIAETDSIEVINRRDEVETYNADGQLQSIATRRGLGVSIAHEAVTDQSTRQKIYLPL